MPSGEATAANWTLRKPPLPQWHLEEGGTAESSLLGVSCPSESLCVAVGSQDSLVFSQAPTGGAGAWHVVNPSSGKPCPEEEPHCQPPGSALKAVSCASPRLCVVVSYEGFIYASSDPTGDATAWQPTDVNEGGGHGGTHLTGVSCPSPSLCVAVSSGPSLGNTAGKILTSTDPAGPGAGWSGANAGGSVQITGASCPTTSRCVAVDNNGDVLTSTDPTGGPGSWRFENLVPFGTPAEFQSPGNALFAASCASVSLCALVGADGRVFTSTEPFAAPADPAGGSKGRKAPKRPRTTILFANPFWEVTVTRRRHVHARFHFFSSTRTRGFECRRDHGRYRRCHSPLRYWVGHGRHVLRVRAIGPTGLRGPAASKRFRVSWPRRGS